MSCYEAVWLRCRSVQVSGRRGDERNRVTQPHQRLHPFMGIVDQICRWLPCPGLPKYDDRGPSELEDRFLLTAVKWDVQGMHLLDASYRHCAHLHERQAAEVASIQNIDLPVIANKD